METLRDNLARANFAPDAAELRAATDGTGDGRTLFGYFSVFNSAYEVNSMWEGNFLETIAPGAFGRSIKERGGQIKALYDHGHDPSIGNKPLGPFNKLEEDSTGGYYEIGMLNTTYNGDLMEAARAGCLGASFRFSVRAESWVDEPKASKTNPRALPERTITDVDLFELGPVTFPASPAATAGMRSTTDEFFGRMLSDPLFVARLTERTGPGIAEKLIASLPTGGANRRNRLVRALGADDATALQGLLSQLVAADAAFDPFVDAIVGADMALDACEATLAAILGQNNPDADMADGAGMNSARLPARPHGSADGQQRVGARDPQAYVTLARSLTRG